MHLTQMLAYYACLVILGKLNLCNMCVMEIHERIHQENFRIPRKGTKG